MKRSLKLFLIVLLGVLLFTLNSGETFKSVFVSEKAFLVSVVSAPKSFLGVISFWKYVIVALALLQLVLVSLVFICKRVFRKHARRKPIVAKTVSNISKSVEYVDAPTFTRDVVGKGAQQPSRGFKRVEPRK